MFITNAVYDLLYLHLGLGPVTSTTIATIVATIASYLGNRYWSFRDRQRTGVAREIVVFAVLNGIGLLIQDAAVACNYYLLGLGHDKLAGFIALNVGIVLATLFRFWSYRRFVWVAPPAGGAGDIEGWPRPADGCRPAPGTPPRDDNDRRAGRAADPAERIDRVVLAALSELLALMCFTAGSAGRPDRQGRAAGQAGQGGHRGRPGR